jgi:hypothetical protein
MLSHRPDQPLRPAEVGFDPPEYRMVLLNAPYFLVKLLQVAFLSDEDHLLQPRGIAREDYRKLEEIGHQLGLGGTELFQAFCQTYKLN